ncbi:hypothetical protein IWW36_002158 [Coemansia brasiliensis]|uniref:VPS4-associated protein 1 n=1 Tax=Coemansia brasiliensis TaxID=2650707 RepID=A0A9W8I7Q3_9FUNG|nr:hypothetical protein IWW36_002158 [Coemansia brasiliensis]
MSASKLPVNCYIQRTAAKEGLCFICNKFTSSLLMTEHDTPRDWFYVCISHLDSQNFCSKQIEASNDSANSKHSQTGSLAAVAVADDDAGDKTSVTASADVSSDDNNSKKGSKADGAAPESESADKSALAATPTVQKPRYILNSNYFYLRQRPFIQRREQQRTEQLVKQLPSVPRHLPNSR